jgi:GMP synthase-like glutamine amidotransferase
MGVTPARSKVLFVTIDDYDRCAPGERGHEHNVLRVAAIARAWGARRGRAVDVTPRHFTTVTKATLQSPDLLALFLAGSWPEWHEMRLPMGKAKDGTQSYGDALRPYMDLVRETTVPILAVCGSHHLVAAAYSGWRAVGHMLADPAHPTIEDELRDGTSYIPSPRPGEIGAFAVAATRRDPIFDGLTTPRPYFMQHHHDEVVEANLSPELVVIAGPADGPAVQDVLTRPRHRPLHAPGERCRVQGMRHADEAKLLYSFQFHPDLPAAAVAPEVDAAALTAHRAAWESCDANGEALLGRFLDLAEDNWRS